MSPRKAMAVLVLALVSSSQLVMLAEAGGGDLLPPDELSLEVLALLEDIIKSKLCTAACISCLVHIGMACPLTPLLFAPCALGRVFQDGCFDKK